VRFLSIKQQEKKQKKTRLYTTSMNSRSTQATNSKLVVMVMIMSQNQHCPLTIGGAL